MHAGVFDSFLYQQAVILVVVNHHQDNSTGRDVQQFPSARANQPTFAILRRFGETRKISEACGSSNCFGGRPPVSVMSSNFSVYSFCWVGCVKIAWAGQ